MSRSQTATLRLVALDGFQSQLVASMLALLNARLERAWSTSDHAGADAELVDVDTEQGRRHAELRRHSGLARRTIAFGTTSGESGCRALQKPLRLHPLLALLSEIEAEPADTAAASDARYRLRTWPGLDAWSASAEELRIFATLSLRALSVADTARLLDLTEQQVEPVFARLRAQDLLERQMAVSAARTPRAPTLPPGFLSLLRRRFGL